MYGKNEVTTHNYNESLSYDRNGNIIYLSRYGINDYGDPIPIDDLQYTYANNGMSNRLLSVSDSNFGNAAQGFKDGTNSDDDYAYDEFGNMNKDQNKGIQTISYNHLNLPKQITFADGNNIVYIYNALGIKIRKSVVEGTTQATTQYMGSFQYNNNALQYIQTAEGYVRHTPPSSGTNYGAFDYVYNYTDHLGNIRLSYTLDPSDQVLKILEENHYYPFGMKHSYNTSKRDIKSTIGDVDINGNPINNQNPTLDPSQDPRRVSMVSNSGYQYKYNGKEYQDELGLNVYDYGARRYDPALGRWLSMDPLAEKYETLSPYNYVSNNPVNAIDPDGRLIVYVNGLLTTQALGMKLTSNNYRPERWGTQIETMGVMWKGREVPYWGNMRHEINSFYGDKKNVFVNGSHHFRSQASERFEMGKKAGNELIAKLQNGTIELTNEETIKIVGHSQGAAHAAGMLTQLLDSEYANRLEAGIFVSSHQPGGFAIPDGVPGMQFSTETDRVSSRAGVLGQLINLFNGSSELEKIEGQDYKIFREKHKGGLGGHSVSTWTNMDEVLQIAMDFINKK
jgi:RHS repeat-associated protein